MMPGPGSYRSRASFGGTLSQKLTGKSGHSVSSNNLGKENITRLRNDNLSL